jgi:hypothetical protein
MYRKLFVHVSFVVLLALAGNPLARAATMYWDNEGGDNRWDNALNWSSNSIPAGSSDNARIVLTDADECLIDSAVSAEPKDVWVGYFDSSTSTASAGDLRMTGGSFAPQNIYVGRESVGRFYLLDGLVNTTQSVQIGDDIGGIGSLVMSGGTITIGPDVSTDPPSTKALHIANDGSTGSVTMTGGIINVSGALNVGINAGADDVTVSNGVLDMLGGTINVGYVADLRRDMRIGHNDATGTVNMSGGTINISGDLRVGSTYIQTIEDPFEEILHPGTGTLTMTGGLINVADSNSLKIGLDESSGWVDLLGGTLMAGDLFIGTPGSGLNITEGMLIINGDKRETVLGYMNGGLLNAYGGMSNALLQYDYDIRNLGKTTITAIPEPATIVLLGLGGLLLLRRRK